MNINHTLEKVMNELNIHVEKLTNFNIKQHSFYERELTQNIYGPFQELKKLQEKIEFSDKERKDLLAFYQKFSVAREQMDKGF